MLEKTRGIVQERKPCKLYSAFSKIHASDVAPCLFQMLHQSKNGAGLTLRIKLGVFSGLEIREFSFGEYSSL